MSHSLLSGREAAVPVKKGIAASLLVIRHHLIQPNCHRILGTGSA